MDNQPLFIVIIILVLFFIYSTSTKHVKQPQPPKMHLAQPYYLPAQTAQHAQHAQHVQTYNPMKQFFDHKYWG